jgi:PAS domain S-box-containing protein
VNISKSLNVRVKTIKCIFEDFDRNIWFGTANTGVIKYPAQIETGDSGKVRIINWKNGLIKDNIASIYQDREGSFWFGTDGGGVYQYRGDCFEQYGRQEGLIDNAVWAILEDKKGGYWIGSEKGLTYFPDGLMHQPTYFSASDWQGETLVIDIHEDQNGYIWVIVRDSGPRKFDPKRGTFTTFRELEDKKIINVEEDGLGNLWFGSFSNGVFKLDPEAGDVQNFSIHDGLGSNTIFNIIRAKNDFLWFATNRAGITMYDGTTFKNFGRSEGLNATSVLSIAEDENGHLWIGSEGDGLYKYDGQQFENCSEKYGVWEDDIYSLICDDKNNIWIGTRKGIEKINTVSGNIKNYGEFEGLSAIETNQNAVFKDSKGHLLFGTINGFIKYNPEKDIPNEISPNTYITDIRVYLQDSHIPEDNIYSYQDNHLTFSFIGLSYVAPEKIRYSYMLEGLDREWSPSTKEHFATYTNLSPGDYTFNVKAMNSNNIWTEEPAKFMFSISAPFWLKGWFITSLILVIGALIYGIHRHRVRKINRNNLLLEDLVHSRTKDLLDQKEKTQKAYDALLETENKLKQVTSSVDAYFWTTAVRDGNKMDYVFITDTYYDICGYKRGEFPSADNQFEQFLKIIHPDDLEMVRSALKRVLNGRRINLTYRILKRNGEIRWIHDNAIAVKNDQGVIDTIHGVGIDITDRKLTEEALKKSEEKYETFIRYSTEAIWCMDLKKPMSTKLPVLDQVAHIIRHAYITDSNDAMAEMFGFASSKDIIGVKLSDGLIRNVKQNEEQLLKFVGSGYRLKNAELYEIDKKGNRRIFLVSFVGIVENGFLIRGWGMQQDITEKKKMELELQKNQKLESVGLLAGGIAHDFNNILTAILGNISLGKLYSDDGGNIHAVLGEAEKATMQAKDLTHQLLTFSKGGAPVKETASICDITRDSASFVLRGSKITCEYECSADLWSVEVDTAQISQVIQNLIINAEQAMPEGKKINVKLENVTLKKKLPPGLKPGKFVKITISDEGIGIPQEHITKIFDPYFTTKQKGSGLGLATSYSIIRRHEGHIQIKSAIGEGTDVVILIPASENQILEKNQEHDLIENGIGRILVMDDEEMVRDLAIQFLSHLGYNVEAVADGESAVESYKQSMKDKSPFKLVIMDLTIPGGMGGKEAIQKLKEIDPDVKAIVSSGYSNDPVLANFKKFGFKAVLAKPYKIETLSSVINDLLNEKNRASRTAS